MSDKDPQRPAHSLRPGPSQPAATPFDLWTMGEQHLLALVENSPVGMFRVDKINGWIYRNQTLLSMLGMSAHQTFQALDAPDVLDSWIHPDDYPTIWQSLLRAEELKQAQEIELRILKPEGNVVYALQRALPEFDAEGNLHSWTGSVIDISERKRIEVLERQEREQMLLLTTALGSATSDNFFETLVRVLTQTLPADMAFVREYVESPRPHLRYVYGLVNAQPSAPFDQLVGPVELAALTQATTSSVAQQTTPIGSSFGMQQTVVRPLRYADGRLLGIIAVSHHEPLNTERTAQILELFSVRAASELERQRNQMTLTAQRANLHWLNELSVRIHDITNLQEIGREVVRAMAEHISAPLVSIRLFDDHPDTPAYVLASNWVDPVRSVRQPRIDSLLTLISAHQGVLISSQINSEQMAEVPQPPESNLLGVAEFAVLLLQHGGQVLGVVTLEYTAHGYVEQLDREILQALAKMLSLAISNALHFEDIEYKAAHDSLTGLFNRTELHAVFSQHVGTHKSAALMLLDLDRFKEVNDALGHNTGDHVLRLVADRLTESLSHSDALVCRLGGDEFAILVSDSTLDGARALALGHQVLTCLQQPLLINGMKLDIGASIGVALYPLHGEDSHALLRCADVAMYDAKRQHAGVRLYDPQLDTHTPERLSLMADLSGAIRAGELVLYYQPKLDLYHNKVIACEALVRWQHPQLGLLSPDRFIPLAEMSDAIHALTARVIEDACRQQQQWRSQGIDLTVAVNLSARNLLDDRIVEQVERMLVEYALPPHALELEITETALMQDPKRAAKLLDRLVALGVQVAVDDFGTGYSSLTYLRRLPLHALKIDRTFISEMLDKPQDMVIVQSIIALAHNLGLEVVAEGVESVAVLDCLRALGCDLAQGYYLSRPVPAADMLTWLHTFSDATTHA